MPRATRTYPRGASLEGGAFRRDCGPIGRELLANNLPAPDSSTHVRGAAHHMHPLLNPSRLFRRDEVLVRPSPIPARAGVYAWYFRQFPSEVPTSGVHCHNGLWLLYIGISPSRRPTNGRLPSTQNLRKRIRCHYRGTAAGSTLRLTLGVLLTPVLGIQLARVASGARRTFADGEAAISTWMQDNAFVCWMEHPAPWDEEDRLIKTLCLPLNLAGNLSNPFAATLSAARAGAKRTADAAPIAITRFLPDRGLKS